MLKSKIISNVERNLLGPTLDFKKLLTFDLKIWIKVIAHPTQKHGEKVYISGKDISRSLI